MRFLSRFNHLGIVSKKDAPQQQVKDDAEADMIVDAATTDKDGDEKQVGVVAAEVARSIAGWSFWVGIIGIGMTAYVYGLDNNTQWAWSLFASQKFEAASVYQTITVIQQVLIAVAKFPIAKLADVFGRWHAFLLSLVFWVLGFLVMAVSQNSRDLCGAGVLWGIGNTGVQISLQIVLADYISARYRGLSIGLLSMPYIVNFAVAPRITSALADTLDPTSPWRWGPGYMCIITVFATAPVIIVMAVNQFRANRKGLLPPHPYSMIPTHKAIYRFFSDIDFIGLLLFCGGWLLLLIAINLAKLQGNGWRTDWIIAIIVVGGVLLVALYPWEILVAKSPILSRRWRFNHDVWIASWVGFFDFFSFYISWTPAYTWSQIVKDYSSANAGYFSNTQSLCLTVFGILAGFIGVLTRQYKWTLVSGSLIRLLGLGLMYRYRQPESSDVQVVFPQVLQGLGGGFLGITLQVAAQVSVKHQDVATVTAFVLLLTEIGGACGTAVVGAVQNNILPGFYADRLPMLNETMRNNIFLMPTFYLSEYPIGTPERDGIIAAYNDFIRRLLIVGMALSVPPVILGLLVTNYRLEDKQNAVSDELRGMSLFRKKRKNQSSDEPTGEPTDEYKGDDVSSMSDPLKLGSDQNRAEEIYPDYTTEPAASPAITKV